MVLGCGSGESDIQQLDTHQQAIINGWYPLVSPDDPEYWRFVKVRDICSSTVIRKKWVLTAKHCVDTSLPPSPIYVTLPDGRTPSGNAIVHPTLDVALIKLDSEVPCTNVSTDVSKNGCHKVPLFMYSSADLNGKEVDCYGFGYNVPGKGFKGLGTGYGSLRAATLTALLRDQNHLVYYPNGSGQIQASGDSGSSCFYKNTLIDVLSSGEIYISPWSGDVEFRNSVTTSASGFRDWVLDQIGESTSRLGVQDYNGSMGGLGVYSTGIDQKIERRIWNGTWNLSNWRFTSFTHPEARWNSTKSQMEYYSLNLSDASMLVSMGWNSGIVPTKFFDTSPFPPHYSDFSRPISAPAVVERSTSHETHMFWQTDLGALGHVVRDDIKGDLNTGWTTPTSLLGSGFPGCTSQPVAVVDYGAIIHLFVRGTSGELLYNKSIDGKTWGTWSSGFGGYLTSAPGAAQMNNGVIYFAARGGGRAPGINGGIWYTRFDSRGGAISYGWKYLPGTEFATSGPGVLNYGNRAHIYYLNDRGQVCQINEATAEKEDWAGPFCPIP
jgi:hypothetical protein